MKNMRRNKYVIKQSDSWYVVVDLVNIDTSGIASLEELYKSLSSQGKQVNLFWFKLKWCFMHVSFVCEWMNTMILLPILLWFMDKLAIVNPRWQVIHKLKVSKFVDKIGGRVYLTVEEAIVAGCKSNQFWKSCNV